MSLPFPLLGIGCDSIREPGASGELALKELLRRSGKSGTEASESRLKGSLVVFGTKEMPGVAWSDGVVSIETTARSRTHLRGDVVAESPKTKLDRAIMAGGEPVVVGIDVDTENLNAEFVSDGTWAVFEVAGDHNEKMAAAVDGGILAGSLVESAAPAGVLEDEAGCSTAGPSDGKYTPHEAVGKQQEIAETLRAPA